MDVPMDGREVGRDEYKELFDGIGRQLDRVLENGLEDKTPCPVCGATHWSWQTGPRTRTTTWVAGTTSSASTESSSDCIAVRSCCGSSWQSIRPQSPVVPGVEELKRVYLDGFDYGSELDPVDDGIKRIHAHLLANGGKKMVQVGWYEMPSDEGQKPWLKQLNEQDTGDEPMYILKDGKEG